MTVPQTQVTGRGLTPGLWGDRGDMLAPPQLASGSPGQPEPLRATLSLQEGPSVGSRLLVLAH